MAEKAAEKLYGRYDAGAVYVFGSLVVQDGDKFYESSDIDLAVAGLEPEQLFEADFLVEDKVNPQLEPETYRTVQLHPLDQLPTSLEETPSHYIPPLEE